MDVKTVTLPKKMEASRRGAPKPAVDLKAGTTNYKASIAMGGQTIPLTIKTEIKERWQLVGRHGNCIRRRRATLSMRPQSKRAVCC